MKKFRLKFNPIPFLLLSSIFLVQCSRQRCEMRTVTHYEEIHLSFEDIRSEKITFEASRSLEKTGKIYFKDNYLFINEINKGIHIFDNTNPSAPANVGFIKIVGNVDIAIRGNILFADSYTDLLSIDISNFENPRLLQRVENVFTTNFQIDDTKGVFIYYEKSERLEEVCVEGVNSGIGCSSNEDVSPVATPEFDNADQGTGQGGSLARFSLVSSYLYVLTGENMNIYNLNTPSQINQETSVTVGFGIETLWGYEDKLFIGSTTGMYIFDNTNPTSPELLSVYSHVFSCDPVVVEGDLAYVTLRSGTGCNRGVDRLEIIDISDPRNPVLRAEYPMTNPHGLGIDNGTLFLCDGRDGLKIYNAKDTQNLNQLAHYQNISSIDVIPLGNILLMIGEDGFYQYDYSDLNDIKLLSKILVQK